eukprot:6765264-Prymnesium_polylepis.1
MHRTRPCARATSTRAGLIPPPPNSSTTTRAPRRRRELPGASMHPSSIGAPTYSSPHLHDCRRAGGTGGMIR